MDERTIQDCEEETCFEIATSFPEGHKFCFKHRDLWAGKEAQKWCEKKGLDTAQKQKQYFYKNVNKAFKKL